MKKALMIGLLVSSAAHAKIEVSSLISYANSTEAEATLLLQTIKGLGVTGYTSVTGHEVFKVSGEITTSHAACENGQETNSIELKELDKNDNTVKTIAVDNTDDCDKVTPAESFNRLLDSWGGDRLLLDCGAGHCWKKIESIQCTHFNADNTTPEFDSCEVQLSSGI